MRPQKPQTSRSRTSSRRDRLEARQLFQKSPTPPPPKIEEEEEVSTSQVAQEEPPPPSTPSLLSQVRDTWSTFHYNIFMPFVKKPFDVDMVMYTFIGLLIIFSGLSLYYFSQSLDNNPRATSCPLAEKKIISPVDIIRKCGGRKEISCVEVKSGFVSEGNKLQGFCAVRTLLEFPRRNCSLAKIDMKDYAPSARVINNLHNHLLKRRITGGVMKGVNTRIAKEEIPVMSPDTGDLLWNASFVSFKIVSHSDEQNLRCVFDNDKHPVVKSLFWFKMQPLIFSVHAGEGKVKTFGMEDCHQLGCFHNQSEVAVIPMKLEPQCESCKPNDGWLCKIPILGSICGPQLHQRCSLTLREYHWDSSYHALNEDKVTCSNPSKCKDCTYAEKTRAFISVLVCH